MAVPAPGNQRHMFGLRFSNGDVTVAGIDINTVSGCNLINLLRIRIDNRNIAFVFCPQDDTAIGSVTCTIPGCVYILSQEYIALSAGYGADTVPCRDLVRHKDVTFLRLQRRIPAGVNHAVLLDDDILDAFRVVLTGRP